MGHQLDQSIFTKKIEHTSKYTTPVSVVRVFEVRDLSAEACDSTRLFVTLIWCYVYCSVYLNIRKLQNKF